MSWFELTQKSGTRIVTREMHASVTYPCEKKVLIMVQLSMVDLDIRCFIIQTRVFRQFKPEIFAKGMITQCVGSLKGHDVDFSLNSICETSL